MTKINKMSKINKSKINKTFEQAYNLRTSYKRTLHHELVGSSQSFLFNSVKKYKAELSLTELLEPNGLHQGVTFNIMTHRVVQNDDDIMNHYTRGDKLYTTLYKDRIIGQISIIWDTMTRLNLMLFRNQTKVVSIKFKDRIVKLMAWRRGG